MTDSHDTQRRDTSRWTDNPFRSPNLTPEQIERLDKRGEAMRIFRATGDTTLAQDRGWFPKKPRRMWEYKGLLFHVVRTAESAAYVGLKCDDRYYKIVVIGLTDWEPHELLVGRVDKDSPKYEAESLEQALQQAAELIIDEIPGGPERRLIKQLDDFFSDSD